MENNEPVRVLQVVGRMDRGGIETMIMNLYRHIDRSKVQFDFLAHYGREAAYNNEIRALGGNIYEMPALRDDTHIYYWKLPTYIMALHQFFAHHPEIKIIHGNMTNTAAIYMPIARKYGIKTCIAHSHNTRGKAGLLGVVTDILQKPIIKYATDLFACSKEAAYWFYPKELVDAGKIKIIPNAVDAQKFRYDPIKRIKMREKLQIGNRLAIVCVARFRKEKNQAFLVQVLNEIVKKRNDVVLFFAGDGEYENNVKKLVQKYHLENHVVFLGMCDYISDLLQAMDVFVLTSLWEGLPVVGVEAQASGLHCVVSDGITRELDIIGNVKFLSLSVPVRVWADQLIAAAQLPRQDTFKAIQAAGYDIHTTAKWLQNFYLSKC